MTPRRLIARPVFEIPELVPLHPSTPHGVGFGLDGELLVIRALNVGRLAGQVDGYPVRTRSYEVIHVMPSGARRRLEFHDETLAISLIAAMGENLLLVDARSSKSSANAVIRNSESGEVVSRFTLGHGIADVRVSPWGHDIWVSYCDEGVYGGPTVGHTLGGWGLVRCDPKGNVVWHYDATEARTGVISDAYAFNLAGEKDAWVYHSRDFPIVRITGRGYQSWQPKYAGATAMAVRNDAVLLVAGYRHPDGVIFDLHSGVETEVEIRNPDGESFDPKTTFVRGVGAALYLVAKTTVYTIADW